MEQQLIRFREFPQRFSVGRKVFQPESLCGGGGFALNNISSWHPERKPEIFN